MFNSTTKLISFDLWQTIIKSNPDYKTPRTKLVADLLNFHGDLGWLYKHVVEKVNREADRLTDADGVVRGLNYRLIEMYRLLTAADDVPFFENDVKRVSDQLCELIARHPPLLIESDAIKTLESLRNRGYKTAVISNTGFTEGEHMRIALRVMGLDTQMDHIILSSEESVSKPSSAIFSKLTSISNLTPEKILHVGDNILTDYYGATRAGFQAAMFRNRKNEEDCETLFSITAIRSLIDVLN